ncbi:hypothetical protein IGI37_001481 [Enterococcus sp. AZ194]
MCHFALSPHAYHPVNKVMHNRHWQLGPTKGNEMFHFITIGLRLPFLLVLRYGSEMKHFTLIALRLPSH